MDRPLVIARGLRGQPLKLVAVSASKGLVYLANPALLKAIESGDSEPIGFPQADVFAFSARDFDVLIGEWEEKGEVPYA